MPPKKTTVSTKRTFTRVALREKQVGRYKSTTPSGAAKKIARRLFSESPDKTHVQFKVREITRGSEKKEYTYHAQKKKLKKPVTVAIAGGAKVTYRYTTVVSQKK